MKAIWTGSIGFGLVNIPVKLFSAIEDSSLDLDMLDKKDHSNVKYKRVNENTGKEVLWENIVKGYKVGEKYVVLEKDDFVRASPENNKTIAITQFVDETEIDTNYFEMPYYMEPEKSGVRAYVLLRDALKKTGKAAVGTFIMREREHLCLLKVQDKIIVLNRIRFAQEIRPVKNLKIPATQSKSAEIKMAINLINQLSGPFDIKSFKDEYSSKLLKIIKEKSKGKLKPFKPMKVVHSKSQDLMQQLKASLSPRTKKKAS